MSDDRKEACALEILNSLRAFDNKLLGMIFLLGRRLGLSNDELHEIVELAEIAISEE